MSRFFRRLAVPLVGTAIVIGLAQPVSAHHGEPGDGRIIGGYYVLDGGGHVGGGPPINGGGTPYLGDTSRIGGADRIETGYLISDAAKEGRFGPNTVFVARWEDASAGAAAARYVGGTFVLVDGGNGALSQSAVDQLLALHENLPWLVIIGGTEAIGNTQATEIAWTLHYGEEYPYN